MREEVIPIIRVEDAASSVSWYGRLGFIKEWEHRFEPHLPAFVSVARGDIHLYLSEHRDDASPDTLVYLWVSDVDAAAREFDVTVEDYPWAKEMFIKDPDGNRIRVAAANSPMEHPTDHEAV